MDDQEWVTDQYIDACQRLDDALCKLDHAEGKLKRVGNSLFHLRSGLGLFNQLAKNALRADNTLEHISISAEAIAGALSQLDDILFLIKEPTTHSSLNEQPANL